MGNLNQSMGSGQHPHSHSHHHHTHHAEGGAIQGFAGSASPYNVISSTATATNPSSGIMMGSATSGGGGSGGGGGVGLKVNSENGSECSSVTSESLPAG